MQQTLKKGVERSICSSIPDDVSKSNKTKFRSSLGVYKFLALTFSKQKQKQKKDKTPLTLNAF